jgi:hypothetical protein
MVMQERLYLLRILMPFREHDVQDAVFTKCRQIEVGYDMEVCRCAGAKVIPLWETHDKGLGMMLWRMCWFFFSRVRRLIRFGLALVAAFKSNALRERVLNGNGYKPKT